MRNKIISRHSRMSLSGIHPFFRKKFKAWIPAFAGMTAILFYSGLVSLLGLSISSCSKQPDTKTAQSVPVQQYHCPMHPTYISDKPGNCPICSMKLVPIEDEIKKEPKILFYRNPMNPGITSPIPTKDTMGMDYVAVYDEETSASSLPGHAAVKMNESQQQQIGVNLSSVERRRLVHTIRASARVAHDPDLYSAIKEAQAVPTGDERTGAAVRLRLAQMGLAENLIKEVVQPGYDASFLLVAEPNKKAWVYVDVYDDEAQLVKEGMRVEFTAAANPQKKWEGPVRAVDRVINRDTRTLRARVEVMNTGGELRSEMFLNAEIRADMGMRLAVPSSAVMDTGTRKLIYVQTKTDEFTPREIQTGYDGEGWVEVAAGASVGEKVVTSANFLVDSESKIKGAR